MKLIHKIVIPIVFVLAFSIVSILFFTQRSLKDSLVKEEFLKTNETVAKRVVALLSRLDFTSTNSESSQENFRKFADDVITPSISRLIIWGRNKDVLYSTVKLSTQEKVNSSDELIKLFSLGEPFFILRKNNYDEAYFTSDEFLNIYIPVYISSELLGAVEINLVMAATLSPLEKQSNSLLIILILSGVSMLISVLIVLRFFVLAPISELDKAAQRISFGDFDYGITTAPTGEIGHLAKSFDRMRIDLKKNTELLIKEKKLEEDANKKLAQNVSKLNTTSGALERALSAVSVVSHQLRTPLTVTKGSTEMLLDGSFGKLNEDQEHIISQVAESNNRLITLVGQMLDVTKIEQHKLPLAIGEVWIDEVIEKVIKDLAPYAKEKNVSVKYTHEISDKTKIQADETKLYQVFQNIIENSIKYCIPKNEDAGCFVDVLIKKDENKVLASVSDSGIGIPKSSQDKIFEKFYRAPNAVKTEDGGSGLGLYIAKSIVEAMDGSIDFESKEGQGAKFIVSFPSIQS